MHSELHAQLAAQQAKMTATQAALDQQLCERQLESDRQQQQAEAVSVEHEKQMKDMETQFVELLRELKAEVNLSNKLFKDEQTGRLHAEEQREGLQVRMAEESEAQQRELKTQLLKVTQEAAAADSEAVLELEEQLAAASLLIEKLMAKIRQLEVRPEVEPAGGGGGYKARMLELRRPGQQANHALALQRSRSVLHIGCTVTA